jgi:hypothetical protein
MVVQISTEDLLNEAQSAVLPELVNEACQKILDADAAPLDELYMDLSDWSIPQSEVCSAFAVILSFCVTQQIKINALEFSSANLTGAANVMTALCNCIRANLDSLQRLSFDNSCHLEGNQIAQIFGALRSCQNIGEINLGGHNVQKSSEAALRAISSFLTVNSTLKTLIMAGMHMSKANSESVQMFFDAISCNSTLACLDLFNSWIFVGEPLKKMLKTNCFLEELRFGCPEFKNKQALLDIFEGLEVNQGVLRFEISFSRRVFVEGMEALGRALEKNSTLTSLEFWHSDGKDYSYFEHLGHSLSIHCSLEKVSLQLPTPYPVPIYLTGFLSSLEKNAVLTSLDLSGSRLDLDLTRTLAASLSKNRTLKSLKLLGCGIGTEEIAILCQTLSSNETLTEVDLAKNNLTSKAVQEFISPMLQSNDTIASLELEGNPIQDSGMSFLKAALEKNNSLTSLNVGNCEITDPRTLKEIVLQNPCISRLTFHLNDLIAEETQEVDHLLQINQEISKIQTIAYIMSWMKRQRAEFEIILKYAL